MKKLLLLGAALLGLCAVGQTARAGDDYRDDYSYERRAPARTYEYDDRRTPECYEGRVVERRVYLPPPPPIFLPPLPFVTFHSRPHYYHRHYAPYGYGYRPGVHIGIGF